MARPGPVRRCLKRLPWGIQRHLVSPEFGRITVEYGRPLGLFAATLLAAVCIFVLLQFPFGAGTVLSDAPEEKELLIESGKELSAIATTLLSLCTGLFVLVAVAVRHQLSPNVACPPGQAVLLAVLVLATAGSAFMGLQVRHAVAYGMLARSLDVLAIGVMLGRQAWLTSVATASAVALVADALLTRRS